MSTNSLPEYGYSDPSGSSTRRLISPRGQQRCSYNHRRSASRSPPRNRPPRCLSPRHPKFGKNSIPNSPHSPVRRSQELTNKPQEHDTKPLPRRPSPNPSRPPSRGSVERRQQDEVPETKPKVKSRSPTPVKSEHTEATVPHAEQLEPLDTNKVKEEPPPIWT